MMITAQVLGTICWEALGMFFLGVVAFAAFLLIRLKRTTKQATPAKKTPIYLCILRLGASICFFVAAVWFYFYCSGRNWSDDYTVKRKQPGGEYIMAVRPGVDMTAPYSKAIYDKAQPGDQLHHGLFFVTLTRNGKLLALEVPGETVALFAWIVLTGLTFLAFLPDSRIERNIGLILVIGLLEAAMIGFLLFAALMPR